MTSAATRSHRQKSKIQSVPGVSDHRSPCAVAGIGAVAVGECRNVSARLWTCRGVQQKSTATCPDSRGPRRTLRDGDLRG
jgi:hypothetical protein